LTYPQVQIVIPILPGPIGGGTNATEDGRGGHGGMNYRLMRMLRFIAGLSRRRGMAGIP
jgi:hypothetical protein